MEISEEFLLYCEFKDQKECEFEYKLRDNICFKSAYDCALIECNVPNNIKVNQFKYPRKIFINCVWSKDFNMNEFIPVKNSKYFHEEISQNYENMIFEVEIGPNISNNEDLLKDIEKKLNDKFLLDIVNKFYSQRFKGDKLTFSDMLKPKILYDTLFARGKFYNKLGFIDYYGIKYESVAEIFDKNELEKMTADEVYLKHFAIQRDMELIAYVYYTFDEELHSLLGFEPKKFPNISVIYENDQDKVIYHDNGYARYKCHINSIDTIYFHSNIVKASHCLDKKLNVLSIFPRKYESNNIVNYTFKKPIFHRITVKEINSIIFKITNNREDIGIIDGDFISFKILLKPANSDGSIR
jgi:hypothetical protein